MEDRTMTHPQLVLASGSPHRATLLRRLFAEFRVDPPDVDESRAPEETADRYVTRLADVKARAVSARHPDSLVIGSDQACVLGDRILGKPASHREAVSQLLEASGSTVTFVTGLCVANTATGAAQVDVVPVRVRFRRLNEGLVERYLAREPAYDSAGSFHAEGLGISLFERIEGGDPTALVGLPLIRLVSMLAAEGVEVP
ncbi:nucleoside triphosphate pyrophosphatase [Aquisalimonas lutea]|uniref:Maf family protein n=1 Tax=Aquisalimonas lutea TaxID=1327750 RepID=UPI0025B35793|nr:nucleoside triphosphate pyrophosphatase [Aquisalimonas lutea]MDN3518467.1 nucleoside triphosphate pyrophosphatase [Aquisalimonas lutea]